MARLITDKRVQELQFSLTKNGWSTKQWGYPFRDASPGFEINVWFGESTPRPDKNFKEITNYLSGKFCASISSVDRTVSVSPRHLLRSQFQPQRKNLTNNYYASLPHETVCTENLTPWKKLLPCHSKAGLSSLLNSVFIMNSNYFSISVDLEQFCLVRWPPYCRPESSLTFPLLLAGRCVCRERHRTEADRIDRVQPAAEESEQTELVADQTVRPLRSTAVLVSKRKQDFDRHHQQSDGECERAQSGLR